MSEAHAERGGFGGRSAPDDVNVRAIERADVKRAADTLADAFADDPLHTWLFPKRNYDERTRRSWRSFIEVVGLPRGHTYATDDLTGVAIWLPPGAFEMRPTQQLRIAPRYIRVLGPRILRGARAFASIDSAHPSEPHWYLEAIGVRRTDQRKGHGRALLEPMLERADREATLAYLETFKANNVAYYEHFGFTVTGEQDIPRGGPHMWSMARRPRVRSRDGASVEQAFTLQCPAGRGYGTED